MPLKVPFPGIKLPGLPPVTRTDLDDFREEMERGQKGPLDASPEAALQMVPLEQLFFQQDNK
jgi:hypothetical protein